MTESARFRKELDVRGAYRAMDTKGKSKDITGIVVQSAFVKTLTDQVKEHPDDATYILKKIKEKVTSLEKFNKLSRKDVQEKLRILEFTYKQVQSAKAISDLLNIKGTDKLMKPADQIRWSRHIDPKAAVEQFSQLTGTKEKVEFFKKVLTPLIQHMHISDGDHFAEDVEVFKAIEAALQGAVDDKHLTREDVKAVITPKLDKILDVLTLKASRVTTDEAASHSPQRLAQAMRTFELVPDLKIKIKGHFNLEHEESFTEALNTFHAVLCQLISKLPDGHSVPDHAFLLVQAAKFESKMWESDLLVNTPVKAAVFKYANEEAPPALRRYIRRLAHLELGCTDDRFGSTRYYLRELVAEPQLLASLKKGIWKLNKDNFNTNAPEIMKGLAAAVDCHSDATQLKGVSVGFLNHCIVLRDEGLTLDATFFKGVDQELSSPSIMEGGKTYLAAQARELASIFGQPYTPVADGMMATALREIGNENSKAHRVQAAANQPRHVKASVNQFSTAVFETLSKELPEGKKEVLLHQFFNCTPEGKPVCDSTEHVNSVRKGLASALDDFTFYTAKPMEGYALKTITIDDANQAVEAAAVREGVGVKRSMKTVAVATQKTFQYLNDNHDQIKEALDLLNATWDLEPAETAKLKVLAGFYATFETKNMMVSELDITPVSGHHRANPHFLPTRVAHDVVQQVADRVVVLESDSRDESGKYTPKLWLAYTPTINSEGEPRRKKVLGMSPGFNADDWTSITGVGGLPHSNDPGAPAFDCAVIVTKRLESKKPVLTESIKEEDTKVLDFHTYFHDYVQAGKVSSNHHTTQLYAVLDLIEHNKLSFKDMDDKSKSALRAWFLFEGGSSTLKPKAGLGRQNWNAFVEYVQHAPEPKSARPWYYFSKAPQERPPIEFKY